MGLLTLKTQNILHCCFYYIMWEWNYPCAELSDSINSIDSITRIKMRVWRSTGSYISHIYWLSSPVVLSFIENLKFVDVRVAVKLSSYCILIPTIEICIRSSTLFTRTSNWRKNKRAWWWYYKNYDSTQKGNQCFQGVCVRLYELSRQPFRPFVIGRLATEVLVLGL